MSNKKYQPHFIMLSHEKMLHCCRICGAYCDDFFPWGENGYLPSYEYCQCCDVEFGVQDFYEDEAFEYRVAWLKKGGHWAQKNDCPQNWDIREQLENIMPAENAKQLLEKYCPYTS